MQTKPFATRILLAALVVAVCAFTVGRVVRATDFPDWMEWYIGLLVAFPAIQGLRESEGVGATVGVIVGYLPAALLPTHMKPSPYHVSYVEVAAAVLGVSIAIASMSWLAGRFVAVLVRHFVELFQASRRA